jgi:hypothetical protein
MSLLNEILRIQAILVRFPPTQTRGDNHNVDLETNPPPDKTNWPEAERPNPTLGPGTLLQW